MTYQQTAVLGGTSATNDEAVLLEFTVEASQGQEPTATLKALGTGLSVTYRSTPENDLSLADLLDLSICLHTIAARENTTELLPDVEGTTDYTPDAQWFLSAFLLRRCVVQMTAKNKTRFAGKRLVSFYLEQDGPSNLIQVVPVWCQPADVLSFARDLRRMYEDLWDLLVASAPE